MGGGKYNNFLTQKVTISPLRISCKKCASHVRSETTKQFRETKTLIYNLSDKAFKGSVVNWALPSLHTCSTLNVV